MLVRLPLVTVLPVAVPKLAACVNVVGIPNWSSAAVRTPLIVVLHAISFWLLKALNRSNLTHGRSDLNTGTLYCADKSAAPKPLNCSLPRSPKYTLRAPTLLGSG